MIEILLVINPPAQSHLNAVRTLLTVRTVPPNRLTRKGEVVSVSLDVKKVCRLCALAKNSVKNLQSPLLVTYPERRDGRASSFQAA
jgi:hypothetical protein